jgi:peptide/nickel transport system substrate-binding protein
MKKLVFVILTIILVSMSMFAGCTSTTTQITTSPNQSTTATQSVPTTSATNIPTSTSLSTTDTTPTSVQANWWDKFGAPQYGGTINVHLSALRMNFDLTAYTPGDWQMAHEALFAQENWTLDRSIYPFDADFVPMKYITGQLAESWEMTDGNTMVVHLHQGVHWQNKAPVNGREFVASDVEAHYKRILGSGANPSTLSMLSLLGTVTADDKYTLTVKFKQAGPAALAQFMDQISINCIESPEFAALTAAAGSQLSPQQDWHNVAGTGAWMISDLIEGSYETIVKNPDYWAYDERYPKNKLPYADSIKAIIIPDTSTSLAALRTAKIDFIGNGSGGSTVLTWQQADTLAKSNPEIKQAKIWAGGGNGMSMRVDKSPFTDIRVRKALNMAVNRPLIAKTYYGGTEEPVPAGLSLAQYVPYSYPFNEWSQDIKDIYSYNITKARSLMNDAGYPNGLKTDVIVSSSSDTSLLQVLKAEFMDIGVDMTITTIDPIALQALGSNRKVEQMIAGGNTSTTNKPTNSIQRFLNTNRGQNTGAVNDPAYEKFVADFNAATDEDSAAAIFNAANKYQLEQAWIVNIFPIHSYMAYQPRLKGYSGEAVMRNNWFFFTARWWIDQSIK